MHAKIHMPECMTHAYAGVFYGSALCCGMNSSVA